MKKGFTLVELVIVIIIVGILSIVAVPIYRGYTDRAKETEGKALLGSILTSQKVYYAEYEYFYKGENALGTKVTSDARLSIDTAGNKYFKSFGLAAGGTTSADAVFTAVAYPDDSNNSHLKPISIAGDSKGGAKIFGGVSGENIE